MPDQERQVVIFAKDGTLMFHSERCRLTENEDGSVSVTDLVESPPQWLRLSQARGIAYRSELAAAGADGLLETFGVSAIEPWHGKATRALHPEPL